MGKRSTTVFNKISRNIEKKRDSVLQHNKAL